MRILSARILHARHDRDFGQVEAQVAILIKDPARLVPYEVTIWTTEPADGGDLRGRLLASASALYAARHTTSQGHPTGHSAAGALARAA